MFATHRPQTPARCELPADAESILEQACKQAAATRPEVKLAPARFVAYLAERLPCDRPLAEALQRVHAADLFLACACLEREPRALRIFLTEHVAKAAEALQRLRLGESVRSEVLQRLRESVLVGGVSKRPGLETYAGHGPLVSWLRLCATRLAWHVLREESPKELVLDERLMRSVAEASELPFAHDQAILAQARQAFSDAVATLSPRQRNLLRLRFVDDLTLEQIARLYRTDHPAILRSVRRACRSLLGSMRALLRARVGAGTETIESILRLARTHMSWAFSDAVDDQG